MDEQESSWPIPTSNNFFQPTGQPGVITSWPVLLVCLIRLVCWVEAWMLGFFLVWLC
jgi:hypothetical protein